MNKSKNRPRSAANQYGCPLTTYVRRSVWTVKASADLAHPAKGLGYLRDLLHANFQDGRRLLRSIIDSGTESNICTS